MPESGGLNSVQSEMIDGVRELVEERMLQIKNEAQELADLFWSKHLEHRDEGERDSTGRLGIRVRHRNRQVLIIWVKVEFRRKGRSEDGSGWAVNYKDINKGRKPQYSIESLCRLGRDWEAEMVRELEPKFAQWRKELAELAKLRRTVADYEKWAVPAAKEGR